MILNLAFSELQCPRRPVPSPSKDTVLEGPISQPGDVQTAATHRSDAAGVASELRLEYAAASCDRKASQRLRRALQCFLSFQVQGVIMVGKGFIYGLPRKACYLVWVRKTVCFQTS